MGYVASPTKTTPLQLGDYMDLRYAGNPIENDFSLPVLPTDGATCLLYVFREKLKVNAQIKLQKR